ncbi:MULTISPECIES: TetR/AcrR family transcriptional regulator [unclassified Sphingomonas]|uniref:TetR/AcrR family transcriptional regulator n=1 Tax=unclassified Sphingomonas TaxID=196159 RepID=UPI00226A9B54|nr:MULTISPECIES: TetR/AcrR family transcriptional regulator [unclassified Sphingomonas]
MDTTAPRRTRRPQAERSADTRAKLIEAAIACLHRSGYSATTVSTVATEAGVSRGAMTHHFAAKNDLMLAVVQQVFEQDTDFYAGVIAKTDPKRFLLELPEMMWGVISRPGGIAVVEIMLASRSEPDLAEKLRALQSAIDVRAHEWSNVRIRAAGFEPHPQSAAIHELYVAAVRGLAIEATFMDNAEGVHRSLGVLTEIFRRLYPGLDEAVPQE